MTLRALLYVFLAALMIDAITEVGLVGSMVGFLHINHHDISFPIQGPQGQFLLWPKPAHFIVNQGHTSNGAAGTAFVLVGVGGFLALWWQGRRQRTVALLHIPHSTDPPTDHVQAKRPLTPSRILLLSLLAGLLTLVALIYTFAVTGMTDHQTIDLAVAAANSGTPYPLHQWTPENWFKQVLQLPFVNESDKGDIRFHLHLMSGWRWNLIPILLLEFIVCVLALMNLIKERRESQHVFRRGQPRFEMMTGWER